MSRKTRKLMWSAPLIAAVAVIGALAAFVILAPATSYRIDRSENTRVWTNIESSVSADDAGCDPDGDSQSCSYEDTMLMPGKTYYYRVFAMNAFGISPVSVDDTYDVAMTEPVGSPEAPSMLSASRNREKEIHLSWTMPTDNGGADLEWYCIVVALPTGTLTDLASGAAGIDDQCKNMTAATTDTAVSALTDSLEGASPTATEGVIVIAATETDDDDNTVPVTMYTHTGLVDPDVITLRYRIYAVNKSDEISTYITNTAEGKTVTDAVDPDTPTRIREPDPVENLRMVAAVIGGTATVNLYWTVPDSHLTAAKLTEADADATRAIVLEYYTGDAEMGDNGWVAVPDGEQDCQDGTETDVAARLTQCVITSTDLGTGSGSRTYRVRYDITTDDAGTAGDTSDDTVIKGLENARSRATVSLPVTTTSAADNTASPTDVLPLMSPAATDNAGDGLRFQPHAATPQTAIDLRWQRNNNVADPVAQPTGYVIEYSTDEGVTWKELPNIDSPHDLGTNTRYTHHGVKPGDRYDYRVFPWHNSVYGLPVTIPASSLAADRPDPVLNLRVAADGTDTLKLDWDMPSHDGGSDILGYLVQVSGDVDNNMTNNNAKAATGTDAATWNSQVAAADDTETEDINESIVTTAATEYTYKPLNAADFTPDGPLTAGNVRWFRVFAINVANDGVATTGGREVGDNGTPVTGDRNAGETTPPPHAEDISATREVKGVTDDLTVPGPDAPRKPSPPGGVVGLTAEAAHSNNLFALTSRGVLLLWNEPDLKTDDDKAIPVTSYVIERKVVGVDADYQDEGTVMWGTLPTDERTAYVDDDPPGENEVRMYRVTAKNDDGSSPTVEVMYPADHPHKPGMPTGVEAESSADGTMLTVSWTAPADNGGSAITSYKVMYKMTDSDEDYMSMDAAAGATMATISGLSPDTSYDVAVVAVNKIGDSDMGTGDGMTNNVPGMLTMVDAEADSRFQITVEWDAPADNGGSAITSYIVEQSYMGAFLDDGIAHPDHVFSGHMDWWETLNCEGMLLAVGSDADHTDMTNADVMMYCGHFLNTAPTNITDATKELSAEAKADVEMYFNKRYKVTDAMTMSASFMDLNPGGTYMYRVRAANAVGAGMWSETVTEMTTVNKPPAGTAVTLENPITVGDTAMVQSNIMDDEGDMLTWVSAVSRDDMIATAEVDDMGMVTITGVGAGTAMITVTAKDEYYAEGTQVITVTVVSGNTAPTVTMGIPDMEVVVGETTDAIDLTMHFSDAEDAELSYSATTSGDSASITINGVPPWLMPSGLTITGFSVGMAEVTVTATDSGDLMISDTFTVTVDSGDLTAPMNVMASGTAPGEMTLTWEGAKNADFYLLLAVDVNTRQYDRARVNDGAARMGTVTGLDADTQYLGIVVAVKQTDDGSESMYDASGIVTIQ